MRLRRKEAALAGRQNPMQSALDGLVNNELNLSRIMARLIASKLKEHSYPPATDRMEWLVDRIEERLADGGLNEDVLVFDGELSEINQYNIALQAADVDEFSDKLTKALTAGIESSTDALFRLTMDAVCCLSHDFPAVQSRSFLM